MNYCEAWCTRAALMLSNTCIRSKWKLFKYDTSANADFLTKAVCFRRDIVIHLIYGKFWYLERQKQNIQIVSKRIIYILGTES